MAATPPVKVTVYVGIADQAPSPIGTCELTPIRADGTLDYAPSPVHQPVADLLRRLADEFDASANRRSEAEIRAEALREAAVVARGRGLEEFARYLAGVAEEIDPFPLAGGGRTL